MLEYIVFQHKSLLIGLSRQIYIVLSVKVIKTFDQLEKIFWVIKLQMQTLTLNSSTCPLVKAIIISCSAIAITSTLELNVIILIFGCDDTQIAFYSTNKLTNTQLCVFKIRCRSSRLSDLRLIHHQESPSLYHKLKEWNWKNWWKRWRNIYQRTNQRIITIWTNKIIIQFQVFFLILNLNFLIFPAVDVDETIEEHWAKWSKWRKKINFSAEEVLSCP